MKSVARGGFENERAGQCRDEFVSERAGEYGNEFVSERAGEYGDESVSERAEQFLSAFDAFAQAVRRARGAPAQGGDRELTLSQYALLQGLADREWAYVRELAEDAGVTPSTATRILDVLERRGIVRRIRSVNDRRAVTVKLTTLGRDLLDGQHAWRRERQQSFFHALPPNEKALAPDLLVRLAKLIDELAAGPSE